MPAAPKPVTLALEGPQVVVGLASARESDASLAIEAPPPEAVVARAEHAPAPSREVKPLLVVAEDDEEVTPRATDAPTSLEAFVTTVAVSKPAESLLVDEDPPTQTEAPEDEISIPPAGDITVDEKFFSEGDLAVHEAAEHALDHEDGEPWGEAAKAERSKNAPHVIERRVRFARYVRWAVAGAAVLCLAATARSALVPSRASLEAPAAQNALAVKHDEATDLPSTKVAEAEQTLEAPKPAAEEAKPEAQPVATIEEDKPALDPKTGTQEKNAARSLLERGKVDDSIAAGERSVAADPEDGEAWLILGAAYQEKGKLAEARHAYGACLKQGKRGPQSECAAMLR